MTERERRGWIVVGAIFVTMFFIWGAINCGAVFFVPVLKAFGWTRARLSVAFAIGWVTGGAASPFIGWLADRVNPKKMMVVGALITGLLWLALSRATSFADFLAINGLFGICVAAATTIPCTIVIASWFEERRGLALGIAFSGLTLGGAAMTLVANYAIAASGWRFGYATLGVPILVVVVPLILFLVSARTREPAAANPSPKSRIESPPVRHEAASSTLLPGLELSQAAKTRSFWMICAAQLVLGLDTAMGPHYIAYLTGVGYSATFAAGAVSIFLVATTAGALVGGPLADRLGARWAMFATFVLATAGMLGLIGARHPAALAANILAGGFAGGSFLVQMPLVMIESLGVRRLGSLIGVTGILFTLGAAVGPVAAGRVFDVFGSYGIAIVCMIGLSVLGAFSMLGCGALSEEQKRFAPSASLTASPAAERA